MTISHIVSRFTFGACVMAIALQSNAQMLGVTFYAQAQMTTKLGDVTGCGFSLTAAHIGQISNIGYDGSIHAYLAGFTGFKGGLFDITVAQDGKSLHSKTPSHFKLAWAKVASGKPLSPVPADNYIASESPDYRMFATSLLDGIPLLIRSAEGENLWLGFKSEQGRELVLNGKVEWEEGAKDQFDSCFQSLGTAEPGLEAR